MKKFEAKKLGIAELSIAGIKVVMEINFCNQFHEHNLNSSVFFD